MTKLTSIYIGQTHLFLWSDLTWHQAIGVIFTGECSCFRKYVLWLLGASWCLIGINSDIFTCNRQYNSYVLIKQRCQGDFEICLTSSKIRWVEPLFEWSGSNCFGINFWSLAVISWKQFSFWRPSIRKMMIRHCVLSFLAFERYPNQIKNSEQCMDSITVCIIFSRFEIWRQDNIQMQYYLCDCK